MDPLPEVGVVTGKNISYSDNVFLTTYLRTNLAFCGGESGSPVFEADGNLAGMMVASLPEMASSFILPKRALSKIFDAIVADCSMRHKKIGIEVQSKYKFNSGQEIAISKVIQGSEADRAGLRAGDVLLRVGDFDVHYREDLHNAVFFCDGDGVEISVLRDGNELSFSVKFEYEAE
jgi:S1-C subfamily serine protease